MAIIRKGDMAAEKALEDRAKKQTGRKRNVILTDKDPKSVYVSKDKTTGKATAKRVTKKGEVKKVNSPVTGKQVAERRAFDNSLEPHRKNRVAKEGSGIIQGGKLVKGGNEKLESNLYKKGNK